MVNEGIILVKLRSITNFMKRLGLKELQAQKIRYDDWYGADEYLKALSDVAENNPRYKLDQSPCVTALADDSADITYHKRLVIYVQTVNPTTMQPNTDFLPNVECKDATSSGIANSILMELESRGAPAQKCISLGSDGAIVMTGKKWGNKDAAEEKNPHMTNYYSNVHKL